MWLVCGRNPSFFVFFPTAINFSAFFSPPPYFGGPFFPPPYRFRRFSTSHLQLKVMPYPAGPLSVQFTLLLQGPQVHCAPRVLRRPAPHRPHLRGAQQGARRPRHRLPPGHRRRQPERRSPPARRRRPITRLKTEKPEARAAVSRHRGGSKLSRWQQETTVPLQVRQIAERRMPSAHAQSSAVRSNGGLMRDVTTERPKLKKSVSFVL